MADAITNDIDPQTFRPKGKIISPSERAALAAQGLKWCPRCRSAKPLEEFTLSGRSVDGRAWLCSPCNCKAKEEWRTENAERERARKAEWCRRNPDKVKAWTRKQSRKDIARVNKAKSVLERAVTHFEGRSGWLSRIAHEIDLSPEVLKLQHMSDPLDGLVAEYVYGET